MAVRKIVVIGPESTGKSSLCEQLADHYHSLWCPEYAREYLLKHGMNYSYQDLLTIAKGQIETEERFIAKAEQANSNAKERRSILFIDTDLYVMKVWCEYVFNNCHQWILEQIARRKYDLYLLCCTDLPWVSDELREYPDLETRERLFSLYREIMISQDIPWTEIRGHDRERLEKAISAVERMNAQ